MLLGEHNFSKISTAEQTDAPASWAGLEKCVLLDDTLPEWARIPGSGTADLTAGTVARRRSDGASRTRFQSGRSRGKIWTGGPSGGPLSSLGEERKKEKKVHSVKHSDVCCRGCSIGRSVCQSSGVFHGEDDDLLIVFIYL